MTMPNLDATGHRWVWSLAHFNFKLEYQKGWDNTVVNILSWITTWLDLEAVKSVLNGAALGSAKWAEVHDPIMLEAESHKQEELRATVAQLKVDMHVMDPELDAAFRWLAGQMRNDLKDLLAKHATEEEGQALLYQHQWLTLLQGVLYLKSLVEGGVKELLLFVVPKVHWVAALNGCHRDAGHQGQEQTLLLLKECFWWPGMPNQIKRMLKDLSEVSPIWGSTGQGPPCVQL